MRKFFYCILSLASACLVTYAIPQRPCPQRLVNDFADIFSNLEEAELEYNLVSFNDSTSNQILVVSIADLEGETVASYAYRIGEQWGVGDEKFSNGIVLLVNPKVDDSTGFVTIQVGYGLEGAIPDVYCKRIVDNILLPHFQQGDYYKGVSAACEELMALASGEISEPRDSFDEIEELKKAMLAMFLFFLLMFVFVKIVFRKNRKKKFWSTLGRNIYTGPAGRGPWNGGSFGGGGFGSGSNFGGGGGFKGFGGGHFGGGGASGKW